MKLQEEEKDEVYEQLKEDYGENIDIIPNRSFSKANTKSYGQTTDQIHRSNMKIQVGAKKTQNAKIQVEARKIDETKPLQYSTEDLVSFLERSSTIMEEYLSKKGEEDLLMKGFEKIGDEDREGVVTAHSLKSEMKITEMLKEIEIGESGEYQSEEYYMDDESGGLDELQVACLAWNCNGSMLGCAYSHKLHPTLCHHKTFITCWALFRKDFKSNIPQVAIDIQSCINCIEFHPISGEVLAGGSVNGEIFIWDVSDADNPLKCSSTIDEYFHRDAITAIQWVPSTLHQPIGAPTQHNLVSLSADGKILVWRISLTELTENLRFPIKGYILGKEKKGGLIQWFGGICMDYVALSGGGVSATNLFLVGTEEGSIYKCNLQLAPKNIKPYLLKQSDLKWKEDAIVFMENLQNQSIPDITKSVIEHCKVKSKSEVDAQSIFNSKPDIKKLYGVAQNFRFEKNMGPTYSVKCSPFHRNLFATCSTDGTIKLFDLLQAQYIQSVEPSQEHWITDISWSPFRASILAVASSSGEIYIFDLSKSVSEPVCSLPLPMGMSSMVSARAVRFSPKQRDFMGVAYTDGTIIIYKLNYSMSHYFSHDIIVLNQLLADSKLAA